ncbi:MAG TPA: YcnI family protein [Acidimicrobiia bacterium]|nr:YcnI family protein [Acidimicrobiia bacterium]
MKRALLVALATGAAVVGLPAAGASAHVTVNPREATAGSYAKLAFRVPNERAGVDTTAVEVDFPADHPLASVSVRPHAGWTYKVETARPATPVSAHGGTVSEVVSKITWTGGAIRPGEFDEFEISAGPLPGDAGSLTFKALQTYRDGEVVRWIETAEPGGDEPDRPAPVLTLTKPGTAPAATTPATAPAEAQGGTVADQEAASKGDVNGARTFGLLGMAFGLLGFVTAAATRRKKTAA